jgi:predicted thioredoxin/glutaredoxin
MLFLVKTIVFSQEMTQIDHMDIDDIIDEGKKYAVLHYYYKMYDDEDYVNNFIAEVMETENALDLVKLYKQYNGDDIIYQVSGYYISSSEEAGEQTLRIILKDTLTGNETKDKLIADLTSDYNKFWSYEDIIETGIDEQGKYSIRKRWELGYSEYFLELFRRSYYATLLALINIEYIDEIFQIHE